MDGDTEPGRHTETGVVSARAECPVTILVPRSRGKPPKEVLSPSRQGLGSELKAAWSERGRARVRIQLLRLHIKCLGRVSHGILWGGGGGGVRGAVPPLPLWEKDLRDALGPEALTLIVALMR